MEKSLAVTTKSTWFRSANSFRFRSCAISHGNGTYQYTDAGPLTAGHVYSYQVCAMYGSGDIRLVGDCFNVPTVIAPLPGSLVPALLSISQPTVTAGNTVVVSGQAFPATGGTVQITLQRDPGVVSLGSATISGGSFATTVTIPADTSPGSYTIRAEAMGAQADTTIQVIAPRAKHEHRQAKSEPAMTPPQNDDPRVA